MGSYYAQKMLGRENPKVGLLNIGAEPSTPISLELIIFLKSFSPPDTSTAASLVKIFFKKIFYGMIESVSEHIDLMRLDFSEKNQE